MTDCSVVVVMMVMMMMMRRRRRMTPLKREKNCIACERRVIFPV
jgi:hypothetical protein